MRFTELLQRWILLPALLLVALILAADLLTPVPLSLWVFYLLPIFAVQYWGKPGYLFPFVGFCSLLTLLGLANGVDHPDLMILALNRLFGIVAIWILSYFLYRQKKTDAALRVSLTKHTAIFETAPVGISVTDEAGNIIETNSQAELILGVSQQDQKQRSHDAPVWLTVHRDGSPMPPSEYASVRALREQRLIEPVEIGVLKPDGATAWISVTAAPIPLAGYGVVAAYTDVSERMQNEQALARLAAIIESSDDAIVSFDSQGVIASWNRSAHNLYGYPADLAIGRPLSMLFAHDRQAEVTEIQTVAQAGRVLRHYETQQVDHKGNIMDMSLTISPVYGRDGTVTATSIIARDVTQQKALERAVRQLNSQLEQRVQERTAELEAALAELRYADQLKEAFLAAISHELRTPLTGVLGVAEALELQVSGPLNSRQLEQIHLLRRSAMRLLEMINSILHYTHLLAGQTLLRRQVCRLAEIGVGSMQKVQMQAERKQLAMQFAIDPPDLTIESDSEGIAQLLYNLLHNAVKFTPDGGAVGLQIGSSDGGAAVELVVWDTGIGIADDQHEQIFEAFTQADGGLTRHYDGIGLGLTFAQRMAGLLGGACTVESTPGRGSRFVVTLPVRVSQTETKA